MTSLRNLELFLRDDRTLPMGQRPHRHRAPEPKAISVSAFLQSVNRVVGEIFPRIWIQGEVSGLKVAASGHVYFSLKDDTGQIKCTLFAGQRRNDRALFTEGAQLEVQGSCSIYKARGDFQINVQAWRYMGEGELYAAYLARKAKLEREGLFAPRRKKTLPVFIRSIVLLTSRHGAAVHDVIATIQRRSPWVRIIFGNVLVQGSDAPQSCIRALTVADTVGADAILLVRGGGSFEDLNAFNDEALARTIATLRTPIIAGIGHESDITIAELVADRRASTPTAAAETLTYSYRYWIERMQKAHITLQKVAQRRCSQAEQAIQWAQQSLDRLVSHIDTYEQRVRLAQSRILSPAQQIEHSAQQQAHVVRLFQHALTQSLAEKSARLQRIHLTPFVNARLRQSRQRLESLRAQQVAPTQILTQLQQRLEQQNRLLTQATHTYLTQKAKRLTHHQKTLEAFHPDRPLRLGYAHILQAEKTITSVKEIQADAPITIRLQDGRIQTKVIDS